MSNLIPLSELPRDYDSFTPETNEPHIVWNVDLPGHLDQDRLLFDVDHLRRIQKMSSSTLTYIMLNPDAKAEEFETSVQGINMDGTALMGRTKKISPADPSNNKVFQEYGFSRISDNYGTHVDVHLLNKAAMVDEVVTRQRRKRTGDEDAWSNVLDSHIQTSLRQSAKEVFYSRDDTAKRMFRTFEYAWLPIMLGNGAHDAITGNPAGASLSFGLALANYGINVRRDSKFNQEVLDDRLWNKRRWSMFTDSQLDRYAAVIALTKVNSIIKVRK